LQKITAEINFMYLRQPVVPQHGVLELGPDVERRGIEQLANMTIAQIGGR